MIRWCWFLGHVYPGELRSCYDDRLCCLRDHQQADEDGVMVLVSREALDHVLPILESLVNEGATTTKEEYSEGARCDECQEPLPPHEPIARNFRGGHCHKHCAEESKLEILSKRCPCYPGMNTADRSTGAERKCAKFGDDWRALLTEHASSGPEWADTYLRIYPCDANKILMLIPPTVVDDGSPAAPAEGATTTISTSAFVSATGSTGYCSLHGRFPGSVCVACSLGRPAAPSAKPEAGGGDAISPLPWRVTPEGDGSDLVRLRDKDGFSVADLLDRADAELIARSVNAPALPTSPESEEAAKYFEMSLRGFDPDEQYAPIVKHFRLAAQALRRPSVGVDEVTEEPVMSETKDAALSTPAQGAVANGVDALLDLLVERGSIKREEAFHLRDIYSHPQPLLAGVPSGWFLGGVHESNEGGYEAVLFNGPKENNDAKSVEGTGPTPESAVQSAATKAGEGK